MNPISLEECRKTLRSEATNPYKDRSSGLLNSCLFFGAAALVASTVNTAMPLWGSQGVGVAAIRRHDRELNVVPLVLATFVVGAGTVSVLAQRQGRLERLDDEAKAIALYKLVGGICPKAVGESQVALSALARAKGPVADTAFRAYMQCLKPSVDAVEKQGKLR